MPVTINDLKNINPFDFQNWVCEQLNARVHKRTGDKGIDGIMFDGTLFQVKQSKLNVKNIEEIDSKKLAEIRLKCFKKTLRGKILSRNIVYTTME